MCEVITKKEIEENRDFIIDTWGETFYIACIQSEGQTFLALLVEWGKL